MKIKKKLFFICVVLYCLISLSNKELKAQSSVSVGFGVPEFFHAGYRFHKEKMGFGFSLGLLPSNNEFVISGRAGFLYHFYGKKKYSFLKPWYVNPGVVYNSVEINSHLEQYFILDLRIGREFSLNHSFGIFTELGVACILWESVTEKNFSFAFDYDSPFIPSINLGLYYRFPEGCNCPKPRKY